MFAGVPQGSVLGPLLFLVFINDIVADIHCNIRLFADDTSLYAIIEDPQTSTNHLNSDLELISNWAKTWKVNFNPNKTESILFSRKRVLSPMPDLFLNNVKIQIVNAHKHLGLTLQSDCQWQSHINELFSKVSPMINCLRSLKYRLNRNSLQTLYSSYILPLFDYCDFIWDNCTKNQEFILEKLHLDALRTICGAVRGVSHSKIYQETGYSSLNERRQIHKMKLFHKMYHHKTPQYLTDPIPPRTSDVSAYSTRSCNTLQSPLCRTELYKKSFLPSSVRDWNVLDDPMRNIESSSLFSKIYDKSACNVHRIFRNYGTRKNQILHCKLRLCCSDLNGHKFDNHIHDTSLCSCGYIYEGNVHFLFHCPNFSNIRSNSYFYVKGFNLNTVLYGSNDLPHDVNIEIIESVHNFLTLCKRFQ